MPDPAAAPPAEGRPPSAPGAARTVPGVVLALVALAVVGGLFASLSRQQPIPAGFDAPWYLWRAKVVQQEGLGALPDAFPRPFDVKAFRSGYPVLAGFAGSITGVDETELGFAIPSIAGVMVALGAGALAIRGLREPPWAFAVYAVAVGASANVALVATGQFDNLVADGLLVAAATAALMAADGSRAVAASILLLAATALFHWAFAAFFGGVLLALAVVLLPGSLGAGRLGVRPWATPSGRLGLILTGSAGAGALALFAGAGAPALPATGASRDFFAARLARDAPAYRFEALGPVAAGGIPPLLVPGDPTRRRGLALALLWALPAAAAAALVSVATVPAHRILALSLGIPVLAAAFLTGAARWPARSLRPAALGRAVGAVILAAGLAGGLLLARQAWTAPGARRVDPTAQAATAGRYLERVGGTDPVVFVIGTGGPTPLSRARLRFDVIRSSLPADVVSRSYVYVGDPRNLLRAEPTLRPGDPRFNRASTAVWDGMRSVLHDRPIVLGLSGFLRRSIDLGFVVGPGVTVFRGPPSGSVPPVRLEPPGAAQVATWTIAPLALLALVGSGWSASLLSAGWATRLALAPALGTAVLVLAGFVAGRLGLDGPGARPWIAVVVALAGWALPLFRVPLRTLGRP